jgi:hypothetical protein
LIVTFGAILASSGQRNLDRHVRRDFSQFTALGDHGRSVDGCHLGAHRAFEKLADVKDDRFELLAALGDQAGVGGHPVDQPAGDAGLQKSDVGGIEENLHRFGP